MAATAFEITLPLLSEGGGGGTLLRGKGSLTGVLKDRMVSHLALCLSGRSDVRED